MKCESVIKGVDKGLGVTPNDIKVFTIHNHNTIWRNKYTFEFDHIVQSILTML